MVFLRGLYQAILVELSKVAVTHDINVLDLAFRYLERLKQIWEQDVMGLQPRRRRWGSRGLSNWLQCASGMAQRSAHGHPSPLGVRRTVSV